MACHFFFPKKQLAISSHPQSLWHATITLLLAISISIYLFVRLSVHPSIHLSASVSINPFINRSNYVSSFYLSIYLAMYLAIIPSYVSASYLAIYLCASHHPTMSHIESPQRCDFAGRRIVVTLKLEGVTWWRLGPRHFSAFPWIPWTHSWMVMDNPNRNCHGF